MGAITYAVGAPYRIDWGLLAKPGRRRAAHGRAATPVAWAIVMLSQPEGSGGSERDPQHRVRADIAATRSGPRRPIDTEAADFDLPERRRYDCSVGSFCNAPLHARERHWSSDFGFGIAVLISSYVLRLQLRDKQELQRDREREHASRVSCWADWSSDGIPVLSGALLRHPVVTVANRTDEPVFGAFVDYRDQTDGHPIRVDVGMAPPGTVKSVEVEVSPDERTADWEPEFLLPSLYFRDTRNRWWYRDTVGYLKLDPGAGNDGFFESGGTFAPTTRLIEPPAL